MQDPSVIPGAATARLRDLLDGPARRGAVLHVGPDAVYVDLGERCLGVLSRRAVHVPCAIRTTLPSLPAIDREATVTSGGGLLRIGSLRVHVARVVRTALPPTGTSRLAPLTPRPPSVAQAAAELPAEGLADLRSGDPAAVPALLGRGSGLTPLGDDVLCGWLATTRLLDDPARPAVAAEALRLAPTRTTRLSAELVACAVAGETIPEFRRLLAALAADRDVDDAMADLVKVGHTSGAGLALGCGLSLDRDAERRAAA